MSLQMPTKYSRLPIPTPPGSLGGTLGPYTDGVQTNLNNIATSINQIIQALGALDKVDTGIAAALKKLDRSVEALAVTDTRLLARQQDFVLLTAEVGGSTWELSALDGYPYLRAVIVDANAESNTLTLPTLGADDRLCITIKCINSGNLTVDGGAADIITTDAFGTTYTLPFALTASGVTMTTYAATLIWTGAAWHVIDNAILVV